MDIGFSQAYMNVFAINITPEADAPTWARLARGISKAEPDGNEELDQASYYDGEGLASTDVTGGQMIINFEGNRCIGDPAQDFIASRKMLYGTKRKTELMWINPEGDKLLGEITLANIKAGGGDANAKEDFSFEAHYNGLPTYTPGNKTEFPESVSATAVSVKVGEVKAVGATATPSAASTSFVYGIEDESIAIANADGTVKGVKAGKTNLTVKSAVLPSVSAQIEVTVTTA